MLGGATERHYRRARPDIEKMPWGSLDPRSYPPALVVTARHFWTEAARQEQRTLAACAGTVEALVSAQAPLDLIAMASRFLIDEVAHAELCGRVASVLGGGAPLHWDAHKLYSNPPRERPALERAAELVVSVFCVGEAFSLPMQQATAKAVTEPLLRAVLKRIAKDEAAHARFGWLFFDWAGPLLSEDCYQRLRDISRRALGELTEMIRKMPSESNGTLGWLPPDAYRPFARKALDEAVLAPLGAYGLIA